MRNLTSAISPFLALLLGAGPMMPAAAATPEDFGSLVQLAPFEVNGKELSIAIHARTKADRRYATAFAEGVVQVVAESVTPETGRGLVIIGRKGEPHPILVFRRFLALAEAGQLDPAVAARAPELSDAIIQWDITVKRDDGKAKAEDADEDVETEKIILALPIPLAGMAA
ncbi:MAG: hypothetical protein ACO3DQ_04245 [Cephaloticoccus sp.]